MKVGLTGFPGAGKTTFGLRIAHELLNRGEVERVDDPLPPRRIAIG